MQKFLQTDRKKDECLTKSDQNCSNELSAQVSLNVWLPFPDQLMKNDLSMHSYNIPEQGYSI